jgi:hypothetical protein
MANTLPSTFDIDGKKSNIMNYRIMAEPPKTLWIDGHPLSLQNRAPQTLEATVILTYEQAKNVAGFGLSGMRAKSVTRFCLSVRR